MTQPVYPDLSMAAGMQPVAPVTKVMIHVQCSHLIDEDFLSKSDPMVVLYMDKGGPQGPIAYSEIGRTENIKNCHNPKFATPFEVNYYFETVQKLRFSVYDIDNKTSTLGDDDLLGTLECNLGQVVSGSPFTKPLMIKNEKQKTSTITLVAEEVSENKDVFLLSFRAQKLDNKDGFLGKSDPYLEFFKQLSDGNWQVVHRSQVIKNNLNPVWPPFEIPVFSLCNNDYSRTLKIQVCDWDDDGGHDLIGEFTCTSGELLEAKTKQMEWPCINPKKKAKKSSYKNSGMVYLTSCAIVKQYSFLDYIFGGCQLSFTVGVDFTASNGDPRTPQSLHHMDPHHPNEYLQALKAVGLVVQDYDSDKHFPALGFGAKIPPDYKVSHEFALNFNPSNPFCSGVDGIVNAYVNCLSNVQLYGPTIFSHLINHVARFAQAAQQQPGAQNYFVLLILTDGLITDMEKTIEAIVHASYLPMSIIIVGVGNEDFSAMNELDGDGGVLRAPSGDRAVRDIVQFVPFSKYKHTSPQLLAQEVLAEVPNQLVRYYKNQNIPPNQPPQKPS